MFTAVAINALVWVGRILVGIAVVRLESTTLWQSRTVLGSSTFVDFHDRIHFRPFPQCLYQLCERPVMPVTCHVGHEFALEKIEFSYDYEEGGALYCVEFAQSCQALNIEEQFLLKLVYLGHISLCNRC